jgi:uncharacterized protein YajQ (UPF0234 family)
MSPAQVLTELNRIGGKHGVGRLDLVENRYVGMKSRGCYETPGGTIMLRAHRAIESITLDREVLALKDDLMPRYARMVYNGYWFSPERKLLQGLIDASQEHVNGRVRVKLYKGTVLTTGRKSKDSLFDQSIATMEADHGAYNQADAGGFIKLNALRMRIAAKKGTEDDMPSFDIVSEANMVEVRNALDTANKEIANRYDFKGSDARIEQKDNELTVFADDEFKLGQVREVMHNKFAKRGVDARFLELGDVEKIGGDKVKQKVTVKKGIDQPSAKKIVQMFKDQKLKVTARSRARRCA